MDRKSKPVDIIVAVVAALIVIAVAAFLLLHDDGEAHQRSRTYANPEHGYAMDYPPDWDIKVEPTRCDPETPSFCVQSVELKQSDFGEVYVFVSFQGDWMGCESDEPIRVSGRDGREYHCSSFGIRSFNGNGGGFLRYFPPFDDQPNVMVMGQGLHDVDAVSKIVKTFRFVKQAG